MQPRSSSLGWGPVALALLLVLVLCGATSARAAVCGDGTREIPEQCDDGNVIPGDGCSAGCMDECPSLEGAWLAHSDAPGSIDGSWQIVEDAAGNLTVDTGFDTLLGTRTPGVRSTIFLDATIEPFTLSGEMSTCDVIDLQIDLLPWRITLTREDDPPPVCSEALPLTRTKVSLAGLTMAPGDQTLVATGRIVLPGPTFQSPQMRGMQILLEDLGSGGAHVFDVTHATRPIPRYADEPCPSRGEGWRKYTYRSVMKTGDAASCSLGTADVLTLRLTDLRPRLNEVAFALRVRRASIAPAVGPLRLTVAFGTTAEALDAARCGEPQPVLACTASANGKTLRCQ